MIISKAPTVCQVLFQVVEMELCVGWMSTPSSLDEQVVSTLHTHSVSCGGGGGAGVKSQQERGFLEGRVWLGVAVSNGW